MKESEKKTSLCLSMCVCVCVSIETSRRQNNYAYNRKQIGAAEFSRTMFTIVLFLSCKNPVAKSIDYCYKLSRKSYRVYSFFTAAFYFECGKEKRRKEEKNYKQKKRADIEFGHKCFLFLHTYSRHNKIFTIVNKKKFEHMRCGKIDDCKVY